MSFRRLMKNADVSIRFYRNLLCPLICAAGGAWFGSLCLHLTKKPTPNLVLAIGVDLITYGILLRLTGGVSKEDSRWLYRMIKP